MRDLLHKASRTARRRTKPARLERPYVGKETAYSHAPYCKSKRVHANAVWFSNCCATANIQGFLQNSSDVRTVTGTGAGGAILKRTWRQINASKVLPRLTVLSIGSQLNAWSGPRLTEILCRLAASRRPERIGQGVRLTNRLGDARARDDHHRDANG